MAQLPVLDQLEIENYGLYPGIGKAGLDFIDLTRPLTLVLGANGIGKTSLISLIFRMLSGPYDLPAARRRSLGRGSLEVREISRSDRRYFANRVNDGALHSTATLRYLLGSTVQISVKRALSDQSLIEASVSTNGFEVITSNEGELRDLVVESAGLGSYSDWVLLLRYVVFLQEDRQGLIWDVEAQTEILRPLFLSASDSNLWVELERAVLQADSRRRNLSSTIFQTSEYVRRQERKVSSAADLILRIATWEEQLQASEIANAAALELLSTTDETRRSTRLTYLIAEESLQTAKTNYEKARLQFVLEGLPTASATSRYILAQLVSVGYCAGCGIEAHDLSVTLEERLASGQCVVCGRTLDGEQNPRSLALATDELISELERVESEQSKREEDELAYETAVEQSRAARQQQAGLREQIEDAHSQLPDEDREMSERRAQLDVLKEQLAELDANLIDARSNFASFLTEKTALILERASEIESAFNRYASAFLLESNHLTWSAQRQRVGQMGESLPFPNFALEMRGTDFESPTARTAADSVSESQREFIDLAFRMALVDLASQGGATIVIDSPDASLDAVFEPKAAVVLSSYVTNGHQKRLIVTSNISSGSFLPELVNQSRNAAHVEPTLVDLFEVGVPTAAVDALKIQYKAARKDLYQRAGLTFA